MSKETETPITNAELDSHLNAEGNAEVSQLYAAASQENSPEHLDELILQAAREQAETVNRKPGFSFNSYRGYSAAASVLLCVFIIALLQNDIAELASRPKADGAANPVQIDSTTISINTDNNAQSETDSIQDVEFFAQERNPQLQAERVTLPETLSEETANADPASLPNAADSTRLRNPNAPEGLNELLDLVEVRRLTPTAESATEASEPDNSTAATVNPTDVGQTTADTDDSALDEIIVTGSRITRTVTYRDDPQSWAEVIDDLQRAGQNERVAEEREAFSTTFPDIDLDNILNNLQEQQ